MRAVDKKEYQLVILIVLITLAIFTFASSNHAEIIREPPAHPAVLLDSDMTVTVPAGKIVIGRSTRKEIMNIFPNGKNLGRSGIYRPQNLDCLFSFSRQEDVLIRMDIGICDLSTSKGIKVNDSFDKVVEQYGNGYTKAYDLDKPDVFDAYYGADQYILFKVENNLVKKIYIGSPVQ